MRCAMASNAPAGGSTAHCTLAEPQPQWVGGGVPVAGVAVHGVAWSVAWDAGSAQRN